ncbi:MAG: DUF2283 domain-containing protein [bacterium]|nr:DUF2283 domain-containing protein [bacterium]
MKNNKKQAYMKYDSEADVLSWELSGAKIDHAVEMGKMIVHFSPKNIPVLLEILDASGWLKQGEKALKSRHPVAVPA